MRVYGPLRGAQIESIAANPSPLALGLAYYQSTTQRLLIDIFTAMREIPLYLSTDLTNGAIFQLDTANKYMKKSGVSISSSNLIPDTSNSMGLGSSSNKFKSLNTGSIYAAIRTITNNDGTAVDGDRTLIFSTGDISRNCVIPAASAAANMIITIKKIDPGLGAVQLSEAVDGGIALLEKAGDKITIHSNGTVWYSI